MMKPPSKTAAATPAAAPPVPSATPVPAVPASAKPPSARPALVKPAPTSGSPASHRTPKTFAVKPWGDGGEGTKTLIYGASGMGKTTLAALAPDPIFIGLDDGGRKIKHPVTGADVNAVQGIETFDDFRDALHQKDLFKPGQTVVIDTYTKAETLGEQYTYDTVRTEGGQTAKSIEDYGYGKGYRYLTETMRLLLTDMDPHIKRGVHVLLLAQEGQATIANLEGLDYLQDGPKLYANKNGTGVRGEVVEWCDHVFRIGHPAVAVVTANKQATKGKARGTVDRVIYTAKQLHFIAKNRMNGKLPEVVAFDSPQDDSLWQFVFGNAATQ